MARWVLLMLSALACVACVHGVESGGFHRLTLRGGDTAVTQTESLPTCSQEFKEKQAASFIKDAWFDKSGCPREDWLPIMAKTDPRKNKVLMNIGMNKGYNWAVWLDVFAPHTNVDSGKWGKLACANVTTAEADKLAHCCGACNDCKVRFDNSQMPSVSPLPHITLIGVDLNRNNIINSELIAEHVSAGAEGMNAHGVTFLTLHAAAGGTISEVQMPDCPYGDELCSMNGNSRLPVEKRTFIKVPMLTLDEMVTRLLDEHGSHFHHYGRVTSLHRTPNTLYHPLIDLLMIDVEGYDCEVLDGGKQLFSNKMARAVIFEINGVAPCARRSVKDSTDMMEQYGFDCYFQGQGRLWRITGCWDERLNFHRWSNIMCVLRGDPYHAALQTLVVTEVPETPPLPSGCKNFGAWGPC